MNKLGRTWAVRAWIVAAMAIVLALSMNIFAYGGDLRVIHPKIAAGQPIAITIPDGVQDFSTEEWAHRFYPVTSNTGVIILIIPDNDEAQYYLYVMRWEATFLGLSAHEFGNQSHWIYKNGIPIPASEDALKAFMEQMG